MITPVALLFLIVGIPVIIYVAYVALSPSRDAMSLDEVFYLIDKHGHKGYVSVDKLRQMEEVVVIEDTPEEIEAYKIFEKERDAKRAAEKKALGFVETECPMCECKFLTRRVNDKHMVEE